MEVRNHPPSETRLGLNVSEGPRGRKGLYTPELLKTMAMVVFTTFSWCFSNFIPKFNKSKQLSLINSEVRSPSPSES